MRRAQVLRAYRVRSQAQVRFQAAVRRVQALRAHQVRNQAQAVARRVQV